MRGYSRGDCIYIGVERERETIKTALLPFPFSVTKDSGLGNGKNIFTGDCTYIYE